MENKNLLSEKVRVVLASASPRREELMRQIGFVPEILPSRVDEVVTRTEPDQVVMELSAQKAEEVAARISEPADPLTVVVGADTVVSIDGKILGKPIDREDAITMLRGLQGRTHHVYTGVTLICDNQRRTFASETEVEVYPMTEEETERYVDSGDPMDKAGAYGIQGSFAAYIKGIKGSYTNVMGLPVGRLYQELKVILRSKGVLLALCAVLGVSGLSGCSSASLAVGKKAEKGYTLPQILMIASTERKRYEDVCTAQIWDVTLGEEGRTFEDYMKGQLQTFLDEMKIMNLMAEEREISLTPQEQTAMSEAAEEYYGALTAEDREHMELTKEAVLELYEDYCMAEKLVQELTEGINLEVSDSEAKVIVVQEVKLEDRQAAETLQAAALEEGADFSSLAEAAGLSVTERSLGRKEETAAYEEAAFALAAGEVSAPVEKDEGFYVIRCVNDYDREATALRKEQIYSQRRQKAFRDLYESYRQEIRISYSGDPFEKLQMEEEKVAEAADFFEIYQKHIE